MKEKEELGESLNIISTAANFWMCCRLLHAELLVNGDYQEFEENELKTWSHNHMKPLQAQSQVDNAVLMGLLFKTEKLWSAGSNLPFR